VERRQLAASSRLPEDVFGDERRLDELLAAMDDAVPDRGDLADLALRRPCGVCEEREDPVHRVVVAVHLGLDLILPVVLRLLDDLTGPLGDADALGQALRDDFLGLCVDELVLERRAATVENEDFIRCSTRLSCCLSLTGPVRVPAIVRGRVACAGSLVRGLHRRDGSYVHESMASHPRGGRHRAAQTLEDRPEGLGPGEPLGELVGDVPGVEIWEISTFALRQPDCPAPSSCRSSRTSASIDLELAVEREVRAPFLGDPCRLDHLVDDRLDATLGRERKHRDARLGTRGTSGIVFASGSRSPQLLGVGVDDEAAVGVENAPSSPYRHPERS